MIGEGKKKQDSKSILKINRIACQDWLWCMGITVEKNDFN